MREPPRGTTASVGTDAVRAAVVVALAPFDDSEEPAADATDVMPALSVAVHTIVCRSIRQRRRIDDPETNRAVAVRQSRERGRDVDPRVVVGGVANRAGHRQTHASSIHPAGWTLAAASTPTRSSRTTSRRRSHPVPACRSCRTEPSRSRCRRSSCGSPGARHAPRDRARRPGTRTCRFPGRAGCWSAP